MLPGWQSFTLTTAQELEGRSVIATNAARGHLRRAKLDWDFPADGPLAYMNAGRPLLSVELDRRGGDEAPRVAVKRFQPLAELARRTRLQMVVRLPHGVPVSRIALEFAASRGGNGTLRFVVPTAGHGEAVILAGFLPAQVDESVRLIPGVTDVLVEVVWEPPWDQTRMSEDARLALNMY